jgi:hypothetical protein
LSTYEGWELLLVLPWPTEAKLMINVDCYHVRRPEFRPLVPKLKKVQKLRHSFRPPSF